MAKKELVLKRFIKLSLTKYKFYKRKNLKTYKKNSKSFIIKFKVNKNCFV